MKIKLLFFLIFPVIITAQTLIFPEISADRIADMWFLKDKEELILTNEGGNVYKSYDGGTTWNLKKHFQDVYPDEIIFIDNMTGFINPGGFYPYTGLIYTTDAGETWDSHPVGVQNSSAFLPLSKSIVLRATMDGEIQMLDNFLNLWKTVHNLPVIKLQSDSGPYEIPYGVISKLQKLPSGDLIAFARYNNAVQHELTDSANVLLKSTDNGLNWQVFWSGLTEFMDNIVFANDSTGWMYNYYLLFKTSNGGRTWFNIPFTGNGISDFYPIGDNYIIISIPEALMFSSDSGESWKSVMLAENYGTELLFVDENAGFTFGDIFYKSTESIRTWIKNSRKINDYINDIDFVTKSTGFALGNYTIYKTTDGGYSWEKNFSIPETGFAVDLEMISDSLGWFISSNRLFKTNDIGTEWIEQSVPPGEKMFSGIKFYDNKLGMINTVSKEISPGYFGAAYHLITSDGGINWTQAVIDSPTKAYFTKVQFTSPDALWGINGYGMWKSTDTAKTWSKRFGYDYFTGGYSFHFYDSLFGVITLNSELVVTTDGGNSWNHILKSIYSSPNDFHIMGPDFTGEYRMVEAASEGKLIQYNFNRSGNLTLTQRLTSYTRENLNTIDVVIENRFPQMWVSGTKFNVLYREYELISTGLEDDRIVNTRFDLYQNYPNPFNPETMISYELPMSGEVEIKIFDVLGSEITTLVNQEQSAGRYEVKWNAGSYPSGIYIYQIKAGQYRSSKKMMLMK